LKNWIVITKVDCLGVYQVEAETAEDAKQALANWDGSTDNVNFTHYAEEYPDNDVSEMSVKED
jgi:hypothetical protein